MYKLSIKEFGARSAGKMEQEPDEEWYVDDLPVFLTFLMNFDEIKILLHWTKDDITISIMGRVIFYSKNVQHKHKQSQDIPTTKIQ